MGEEFKYCFLNHRRLSGIKHILGWINSNYLKKTTINNNQQASSNINYKLMLNYVGNSIFEVNLVGNSYLHNTQLANLTNQGK